MLGDPTLFARHDFVESSWALITPIHERWAAETRATLPDYEAGEWRCDESDALIEREGRRWRTL
jgi:glucose-6-phosphate 1-dehydrogenase